MYIARCISLSLPRIINESGGHPVYYIIPPKLIVVVFVITIIISCATAALYVIMLHYTGSSRKNVKSKSVCTGVNFHKKWFLWSVLG